MSTEADSAPKLSPVEGHKADSQFLRGTLAEELADPSVEHLSDAAKSVIKFHGSYQQEDRDARKTRSKAGVGKAYMFMIRLKLPGGKLTPAQYLGMDDLAGTYANGTLRFTTRQSIQFHGVLKGDLVRTMAGINATLVTTLGGCGDVNRNVMACPAPTGDPVRVQMQELADMVAAHLAPTAAKQSYHEIWLNGVGSGEWGVDSKDKTQEATEASASSRPTPHAPLSTPHSPLPTPAEPIYGRTYLPRKFKVGFALPEDNCTDILSQCLGFLAVVENGRAVGYNLYAGGGQGMTNSKPDTFPHLALPVCFVTPDEVVAASEAVVKLFRDHGNRADRKRARLKYLVHDWGVEKFREVFAADYWKKPLVPPRDIPITGLDLHLGWQPMGVGKWFLGISVENGRVKDDGSMRLRSGLRAIVERFGPDVRLTAQQDVLLCGISTSDRGAVDSMLNAYGIPRPESLPQVRKWSMACPAIPTCPLAITESERALPGVVAALGTALEELGLGGEPISVRMTGCPNGCARPYQSEIGIVGRGGTKYTLYVGGDSYGRRLNAEVQDSVPIDQIVPKLRRVFAAFKAGRAGGELFGDYCHRVGIEKLQELVQGERPV